MRWAVWFEVWSKLPIQMIDQGVAATAGTRLHLTSPPWGEVGSFLGRASHKVQPCQHKDKKNAWPTQFSLRPVLCGLSSCWQLSAGGWLNVADTLQSRSCFLSVVTAKISSTDGTTAQLKHQRVFFWWEDIMHHQHNWQIKASEMLVAPRISHCHTVTRSHVHTFTLSHFHTFTLSHFHTFTL